MVADKPLVLPLAGMVAGLCSAHHLGILFDPSISLLLLLLLLAAIFLPGRVTFHLLITALFFAWGSASLKPFLQPSFPPHHLVHFSDKGPVILEGVIAARPDVDGPGSRVILEVSQMVREGRSVPATGRLLLFVREGKGEILTGDRVRLESRIRRPESFGLPGEFDYGRHLAYRQIFVTASVPRASDILVVRQAVAYPVQRWFDRLATELGDFIGRRSPKEGGVLRAILVGERGYVPAAVEDAYARAGINHILSISGFHVGVIALTIHLLLLRLLLFSEFLSLRLNLRRTVLFATLPPVVFYLFLVGLAPATVRSVVMIAIVTMAMMLERESDPLNTLATAAFGILLFTPQALFDISFQLSFVAIWGILILTPLFMEPFSKMEKGVGRSVILLMVASLAATTATLLPVIHGFHRGSVAGLLGNLVAVPLLGYGVVVAGFAALPMIYLFPYGADFLLGISAWLVRVSDILVDMVARIPPLPLRNVTLLDLAVLYSTLMALSLVRGKRARYLICLAAAGLVTAFHLPWRGNSDGMLRITFFSVGQGESTLITFPDGRRMLVDGGGSPHEGGMEVGKRLLAPALWSMGVDRLDVMVLTHPHPDHLKGLVDLASQFPVGEFWETGIGAPVGEHGKLRTLLAARGVPVRFITSSSNPVIMGGVRIEPLAPESKSSLDPVVDQNEYSLVFRLVYGRFSMLFTGDMGRSAGDRLLTEPSRLRCTVLKVPHHGSRHSCSSRLLDAASPSLALISAGRRNVFGLPSPDILMELRGRGTTICRTDLDGTVDIVTDGTDYRVRTFANGHFY